MFLAIVRISLTCLKSTLRLSLAASVSLVSLFALRKQLADLFDWKRGNQGAQLAAFRFFDCGGDCVLREEGKAFHATPFVFDRSVCRVMRRHCRGHVADDGLNDGKRNPGKPGIVTERMAARMKVFCADRPCAPILFARGLNPQPFKELFDPVGNARGVGQIHFGVFRENIDGFRSGN